MNEIIQIHTADTLIPRQADTDSQLINLWVYGRSHHTQRIYRADATRLLTFANKPLHRITLMDLQAFDAVLVERLLGESTRRRTLATVKSLLAFAHRLGYLPFDVGRPLRLPAIRDGLSERILDETQVQRMIALEPNPRNVALIYLIYMTGVRVSEVCGLRWVHVQDRDEEAQITVFGKGSKTRSILIPTSVKQRLQQLRGGAGEDEPVFRSRKRRPLSAAQVLRIVKHAAKRAGIARNTVVHTLRHCHASHALDRGAPIHLVQQTLGHASVATTGRYLHARPTDSSSRYLSIS